MEIPRTERLFLDTIAVAQQGGSTVSVEAVAAHHGRGLVSKESVEVGDTIARQQWPLAFCQDVPNSWRCKACAVCGKFTGTLSTQLRLLATATADDDTWKQVANAYPEARLVIEQAQKETDAAIEAAQAQAVACSEPADEPDLPGDDDCDDDDLTEICFLPVAGMSPLVIPDTVMDADSQTLSEGLLKSPGDAEEDKEDAWGVHTCSSACADEALFRCIPLLNGEGQPAFAELLRRAAQDGEAPLPRAAAALDTPPTPEHLASLVAVAIDSEVELLAESSSDAAGPGMRDIAEMLQQLCRERSESLAIAARLYAWTLARYVTAPAGVTLPLLLRHLTLMCATPWWDVIAARGHTDHDSPDHESPAELKHTVLEALVLLRALLQPRFETAIRLRAALGLEDTTPTALINAASLGGACSPFQAAKDPDTFPQTSEKATPGKTGQECSCSSGGAGHEGCEDLASTAASGIGAASAANPHNESLHANEWASRAAARGWADVAYLLAAAEQTSATAVSADELDGDFGTGTGTLDCPSLQTLPILFSADMLGLVVGLLDLNTIGVSISSPVAEALQTIGSVAATDSIASPAEAAAATSAHLQPAGVQEAAQTCVHRITSALLAASAARRIEGSDEPDPQAVANTAVESHDVSIDPATHTAVASMEAGPRDAAAVWRAALVGALCPPVRGTALFPLVAMTNHKDQPDAEFSYPEGTVAVRLIALQTIEPGQEVCMSYCDETLKGDARVAALQHYGIVSLPGAGSCAVAAAQGTE